jgi:hypothetical protein
VHLNQVHPFFSGENLMTLSEQLAAEQANHDPHGFKAQGENSAKHAFVNTPYQYQAFPVTVYKEVRQGKVVNNVTELDAAKADGWVETDGVPSAAAHETPAQSGLAGQKAAWKPDPPKPTLHKGLETLTPAKHT